MYGKFFLSHEWHNIDELLDDYEIIKVKKKIYYLNTSSVFDIEASSFYVTNKNNEEEKQACMYAWVFGINGKCVRGRTWNDFKKVLRKIVKHYNLSINKRLVVYVHNLAYEFQWIQHHFKWNEVFSLDERRPVIALTEDGIEFRCSYILTNSSLELVGKNLLKYKVEKLKGDLNYNKIRTSETPLTKKEWRYILNDGLVVMAHIQEEIERLGDITRLPKTSTGYVREYVRKECFTGEDKYEYRKMIQRLTLTVDDYMQLKRAFSGGFVHSNVLYVDETLKDVYSFDETSAYPGVMISSCFPMSKAHPRVIKSMDEFNRCLKYYCCLFDVRFTNIKAKFTYDNYISRHKCMECIEPILNNGRIVEAKSLIITVTEYDWEIIKNCYTWDNFEINNFKCFDKGYLPRAIIRCVLKLYGDKTSLKDVPGMDSEYMNSKRLINAMFGMCVTDPCRDEIIYDNEWKSSKGDINSLIDKYNKSRNRFLYYTWGVWITAIARYRLWCGINEFKEDYIYSDTDSLKVFNKDKHMEFIYKYNKWVTSRVEKCLKHYNIPVSLSRPKTIKGVVKPIGVFEYEGYYKLFKTCGAKRYMYFDDNDKLHITISGVSKKYGSEYLLYKYKTPEKIMKNFTDDLIFPSKYGRGKSATGKLLHTYIDYAMKGNIIDYKGNETSYNERSGVHLEPTSYNLSFDAMFVSYISNVKENFFSIT